MLYFTPERNAQIGFHLDNIFDTLRLKCPKTIFGYACPPISDNGHDLKSMKTSTKYYTT